MNNLVFFFAFFYVFILLYLRKGWLLLPSFKQSKVQCKTMVTVLIAARNEEENIADTIEAVLAQDYPKGLMEFIIVDDHSTDNTASIIASYKDQGVRLLQMNEKEKLNSYKKKAITEAIAIASGELMVATDADCKMQPHWLSTVVAFYEHNNLKLISSPVVYFKEKNWFERLQTLEFLYLIGLGAASIGLKKPSTCNGANLAYRRDVFYELNGFKGIDDLASGDDELFLHKVAAKYPDSIGFCKSREAIVYTNAKPTIKAFLRQRKRWASKSTRYKEKKIVVLGVMIWLFNFTVLLSGIFFFTNDGFGQLIFYSFLAKILVELVFLYPITAFAQRKELLWYLPVLSIIHVLYMVYIGIAGNTGKYQWKGRLVR